MNDENEKKARAIDNWLRREAMLRRAEAFEKLQNAISEFFHAPYNFREGIQNDTSEFRQGGTMTAAEIYNVLAKVNNELGYALKQNRFGEPSDGEKDLMMSELVIRLNHAESAVDELRGVLGEDESAPER